jgi:hypothetical protein
MGVDALDFNTLPPLALGYFADNFRHFAAAT